MRTLNTGLALCAALLAVGCAHAPAKVDWISVGPAFAPKPEEQVEVLRDYSEIRRPYGAIGEMKGNNLDRDDAKALSQQMLLARRLAAQHGADAVVIKRKELVVESGPFESATPQPPEYYIHARAFKYVDKLTPEELEIAKRWTPARLDDINLPIKDSMPGLGWNGSHR